MGAAPASVAVRLDLAGQGLRQTPLLIVVAIGWVIGDALGGHGVGGRVPLVAFCAAAAAGCLWRGGPARPQLVAICLACAAGHLSAYRVYTPVFPADHIARAPSSAPLRVEGVLVEDAETAPDRTRLLLQVERVADASEWQPASGLVLITVGHTRSAWVGGQRLRLRLNLRPTRNFGNPGEFDRAGYLARRGVYVTAYVDDDERFEALGTAPGWLSGWLARWRRGVAGLFRQTLPDPAGAVLRALIVGTDDEIPRPLRVAFNRAGVSHVLSISGLHIGLVAALSYVGFRWLLARSHWLLLATNVPKLAVVLSVVPVLLYTGIAGSNVATLRSVLMALIFLGAIVVDRPRHLRAGLAAAAVLVLMGSPGSSLDISFQLSFAAVVGLVEVGEWFWPWWKAREEAWLLRLRGWRGRLAGPIASYFAVSIAAIACTTPLTAYHFNQVSLIAMLANAVVVPLLGSLAVILGLTAAVLYLVCEPLARLTTVLAGPVVALGVWLVERCGALPFASLRVVTPTLLELALAYAALITVVRARGATRRCGLAVLIALAAADGVWWYAVRHWRQDLRITFLSVGQGDSAVVEFPGSEVMVIDGGGLHGDAFDVGERIVAPFLWSRKIARVDYLVLTHPQWDHFGGLNFLAANFSPREFWSTGTAADSERFTALARTLAANDVRRIAVHAGQHRLMGGVGVTARWPPAELDGLSINNQSLVLDLGYGPTRVLFPGDIERSAEDRLVATSDGALASAILKVPHHGSKTSSSDRFLEAVRPRIAVVSAAFESRIGLPNPDILRRYAARQAVVVRTDLDGAIAVRIRRDGAIALTPSRERRLNSTPIAIGVDSISGQR